MKKQAVIFVGGKSMADEPKCLIKFNNIPFLAYQLELLYDIEEVILCTGFQDSRVKSLFGNKFKSINLIYSSDPFDQCGTGTALKNAEHLLEDYFLVLQGDVFVQVNYGQLLMDTAKRNLKAVILTIENTNSYEISNVFVDTSFSVYAKYIIMPDAKHLDIGVYVLCKDYLKYMIKNTNVDFSSLIGMMSQMKFVSGAVLESDSYEIGSQAGIEKFRSFLCL